jgi:uncharacterized LabA/DUF88 family protein
LSRDERVAILVDGSSLYDASLALGFDVDFKKLFRQLCAQGRLVRPFYFVCLDEGQDAKGHPFLEGLKYSGCTVVAKPSGEYVSPSGRRIAKSSIDVDLAVAAMRLARQVDHVVICSDNGNFLCLVVALQQMGKRVSVVSTLRSGATGMPDELRRQADAFIDLQELKTTITTELFAQQREGRADCGAGTGKGVWRKVS